jgi:hypothetical protein
MPELTILCYGLAGALAGLGPDSLPEYPSLELLLIKSNRSKSPPMPFHQALAKLFGLEKKAGQDLPVAALTRLVDDSQRPEGVWMRADPVHLNAGMDCVIMQAPVGQSLSQHDAIILGAPLKELFSEYGWEFEIPVAGRWYLKLDSLPALETREMNEVTGMDVKKFMPAGADRMIWDRLANEVQMLLHASAVNQERQRRGLPVVNSLWFWGCGILPDIIPGYWAGVMTDQPAAQGLSMLSATPCEAIPASADAFLSWPDAADRYLLVLDPMLPYSVSKDFNALTDKITWLDQAWFGPLLDAVKQARVDSISLCTEGNTFTFNRRSLLKFWRRKLPVTGMPGAS